MDMSFAIQALSAEYLVKNHQNLKPGVIPVPSEIDTHVAFKKLSSCDLAIDKLTGEQERYINSWIM
jgi:adenosylhomocysteinase